MKTPDEIKKGLECCGASIYQCADDCPYRDECRIGQGGKAMMEDALALIQQLEKDKADLLEERELNDFLRDRVKQLEADKKRTMENAEILSAAERRLEAERDALAADFKLYRERNIKQECGVYACDLCKHGGKYEEWEEIKCPKGCMGIKNWEWRGVQKD